jgi:superfamily II DNA/RNA helicase
MERKNFNFTDLKYIILDEADQMLKLGFKEDIERIM